MKFKKQTADYIIIALGAFLLAFAVEVIFVPQKISSGGISTVGTVLFYVASVPLSVTNFVLNIALFVFGYRILSGMAIIKTVAGIILLTVFFEICSFIPDYEGDMFSGAIAGGTIMGLGLGLVLRRGGSTGGTDFLGVMIHRIFAHISLANIILFIDVAVILFAGVVFGSVTVTIYSAVALFVSSKVCDALLSFGNAAKALTIISSHNRSIADAIMNEYDRGVTGLYCKGMYNNTDKIMLYCVVSPREVPKILMRLRIIDPSAFVVISDAREVLGNGFRSLNIN